MKIHTRDLVIGTIMSSGEVVKHTRPANGRMIVMLENPKTGKVRQGDWNLRGTVVVKSHPANKIGA
jgi:hypothetical protein